jgi:hypothetical protein
MGIKILHLNIKRLLLGSFINQFVKYKNQGFPLVIHANSAVKECAVVISFENKSLHWSIDKIHSVPVPALAQSAVASQHIEPGCKGRITSILAVDGNAHC